jgi:hypothetical protein
MRKRLILVLVLTGFTLMISNQSGKEESHIADETGLVTTLGFEDSGSSKSFEDDWGG